MSEMTQNPAIGNGGRKDWIVTLRAFAAIAVVLLHSVSTWVGDPLAQGWGIRTILDGVVIQVLVRWAIPIFLMISGLLLLDPQKAMGLKKIYKYIFRSICVLAIFGFAFCFIECVFKNDYKIDGTVFLTAFKNLIEGQSWDHMWYIYALIGLYILTPVLRSFTERANAAEMRFVLCMLFVFTICVPTVNKLLKLNIYPFVPISTFCVFYYLLGHYLSKYQLKVTIKRILFYVGLLGMIGSALLDTAGVSVDLSGENIFTAIFSAGLFSLCIDNSFLEHIAHNIVIRNISECSFGIYIFHPLFLNLINKGLGGFTNTLPVGVGEGVLFVVSLLGAFVVTRIICVIPFFGKILMSNKPAAMEKSG